MPVYFGPPATSDPNDDVVLVGAWPGGSSMISGSDARAALARLRKTEFAGVDLGLAEMLMRMLANPPRRRKGRPPNAQRKAAIIQFIRERQRSGGWRRPLEGTAEAVKAATIEFGISRDYAYELLEADQEAGRVIAPATAALVPIGRSPAAWSPARRARAEEVGRMILAEKRPRRRRR
jgi:hypothetical protein